MARDPDTAGADRGHRDPRDFRASCGWHDEQHARHRARSHRRTIRQGHTNEPGIVAGRATPVFDRDGVRYGVSISNDANYPETAQALADHGAAVICQPLDTMPSPGTAAGWHGRSV